MTHRKLEVPILEAKLYPAVATASPLARPRLDACSEVLDGRCPVVVVAAPAGYGKSTLMAGWHARLVERSVPCAWLSIDKDDGDKVRFMRHLVAALQMADARIGQTVAGHLSRDFTSGAKPLLESLAGDLARVQGRIVLFLDDLQFVVEQPEVMEIVDWLVKYAPRTVQFVIGTREEPRLRLGALRVRRQLFEVDIRQMQFDIEEVAQFCRSRLGHALPPAELQQLLAKTEGWPAALELAALALHDAGDPADFIEQFAGTDSSVVDYLGEVVLSCLDERTRAFVFAISQFDRVNVPLAQAASGVDDAEALLRELRARHLFLIPLDRAGEWVRFHHLVGEFFRERFRRSAPAQARECLARGARWLHANGLIEEAVGCAIRAQDWEQAAPWVAACVEELVFRHGYHQTLLRWMNALPEAWVDRYPVIRIQYAFALSFYPRHQEYEAQVHRLERQLQGLEAQPEADARLVDELRCAVELQAAMSLALRDEGKRGGELAAAWLARWPDAPLLQKGVMGNVRAFGHKTVGEIDKGLDTISETRRWLEQGEGYYALAWTAYVEAVLLLKRGSYIEARRACTGGLELVDHRLLGHPAHASLLHTLLAGIAYEFDEIGAAVEHMDRAMSSVAEYGPADAVIVAYLTHARLQRLRHDEGSALVILREGQELGARRGLRRVTLALAAEECSGLARVGRHDEARVVAARFGFGELPHGNTIPGLVADKAFRAASRFLLQQSPGQVARALDEAIAYCQERGLAHRWVELLLLRALARRQDGEWAGALTDLQQALSIGAPRHYLRVFLDEADELRPLVERLEPERLRGSEAGPLARQLQQSMRRDEGQGTVESPGAIAAEELTRREVAILKRLESGLSNKEIAEAIFISEGTLKWHLHNVYGKLGVKNRSGALTKARTFGLL